MSSTFFLDRDRPASIAQVVSELHRPGLRLADVDLEALRGPWPDGSLLFYLPGHSSRGVEVRYTESRFEIRLLAVSAPEDYDLAFRLLEVLGGDRPVASETGERTPADQIRARFGGDWMVSDMAAGIAVIRSSLSAGETVRIEGPVNALEISPGSTIVATELLDALRRAQARPRLPAHEAGDGEGSEVTAWERVLAALSDCVEEHEAELCLADEAAAPLTDTARAERSSRWQLAVFLPFFPIVVAILALAVVIRLLTVPLRGWIGERRYLRRWRERQRTQAEVVTCSERLARHPDDIDLRHRRAVLLFDLGYPWIADRELGECLRVRDSGELYLERASVRFHLRLDHLARSDVARARELGVQTRRPAAVLVAVRVALAGLLALFISTAGLDAD